MSKPMVVRCSEVKRRRDTRGICIVCLLFISLFIVLSLKAYDRAEIVKQQEIRSMCNDVAWYTHSTVNCIY